METNITILSFKTGFVLFVAATLTLLVKGGSFILVFTHLLPGLVYGFVLATHIEQPTALWRKIVFIVLSTALYIFCAFQVDFINSNPNAPAQLFGLSIVGALILKLTYDLLLTTRFTVLYTAVLPMLAGALGSGVSVACMYWAVNNHGQNEFLGLILWMGMFAIFPAWQYLLR